MKGWYAEKEVFTVDDLLALKAAREMVERCPPKIDDEWVRCHELVRAFMGALEVVMPSVLSEYAIVEGKCFQIDHSWIVLVRSGTVLDLYTPGQLPQVQLVDRGIANRKDHYVQGPRPGGPIRVDVVYKLIERMRTRST